MAGIRLVPIDEIRLWWKMWSIRLGAFGTLLTSYLVLVPDAAINMWNLLPLAFQSFIPAQYMPMVGVFIFSLGLIARLVKQRTLEQATAEIKFDKAIKKVMEIEFEPQAPNIE